VVLLDSAVVGAAVSERVALALAERTAAAVPHGWDPVEDLVPVLP
jgi:hypothetical protein